MKENQLPKLWSCIPIVELLTNNSNGKPFQQGWSPQCENYPADEKDWGVLKTTAIQDGEFLDFENKKLPENIEPRTHLEVVPGDILMTCAGPRNRCGVVCFVKKTRAKLLMSGKMYRFRSNPDLLDAKYLEAFIRSHEAQLIIDSMKTGISDSGLNLTHGRFSELQIPLAPIYEQKRIVAKIEELFSELDNGVTALKTAREQLKVYRQALLKNAFEGKLTQKWRKENKDKLETPKQLLTRIQLEREARYQQQLDDWEKAIKKWEMGSKKGTKLSKPRVPHAFEALSVEIAANLPSIPNSWFWGKLGNLTTGVEYGTSAKSSESGLVPVIRMGNLQNGKIDWSDLAYTSDEDEIEKYKLQPNDVLFNRTNSPELVGKTAKFKGERQSLFAGYLIRVNQIESIALSDYVNYFLNSHIAKQYGNTVKTDGVNQSNINGDKLQNYPFPFCSVEEQSVIVEILEEKLSLADTNIQDIEFQLVKAETLRQSILKKAFSGQLIPQEQENKLTGKVELKSQNNVIPFPAALPGIANTDLHAGIIAMAYRLHEQNPDKLDSFGHVKAEKISHLVESHLGLNLGRQPVKDAAGPNDYPHLKKVEHRASKSNWFDVKQQTNGQYVFIPKAGFDRLLEKTHQALDDRLGDVENLLQLMLPMTMRQAEVFATVYAAWNNLLILGKSPSDEKIVTEARENWHESKLKITRDKFFTAINWMRQKGIVPSGRGHLVAERATTRK